MATTIFGDFEWDEEKARSNIQKHGVSFEEAASVFLDVDYMLTSNADEPDRFVALGFSQIARLLVVVHIERSERIRIISARTASRTEAQSYERRR